jgi:hypothetical protein
MNFDRERSANKKNNGPPGSVSTNPGGPLGFDRNLVEETRDFS